MYRWGLVAVSALLTLVPTGAALPNVQEPRGARELIADLDASDAAVRVRAACGN